MTMEALRTTVTMVAEIMMKMMIVIITTIIIKVMKLSVNYTSSAAAKED